MVHQAICCQHKKCLQRSLGEEHSAAWTGHSYAAGAWNTGHVGYDNMCLCCVQKTQPQNPGRSRSCTATWHKIRLTSLHFWFREMTLTLSISLVCLKKNKLATNQKEGLRDSSSHNTRQVLIASRLLKVNVILTFQSLSLIAFSKTLTANTRIWGHFLLDFCFGYKQTLCCLSKGHVQSCKCCRGPPLLRITGSSQRRLERSLQSVFSA